MDANATVPPISGDDVLNLLDKAARVGGDPAEILIKANIPHSWADFDAGHVQTVSREQMAAIYRECIVTIGWHSSRLDNKPQMHPDEFRLLCYCVITAPTFAEVMERLIMFYRTRSDRLSTLALDIDKGVATLSIDTLRRRKSFGAFLSDLAGMSIFTRFFAWLIGLGGYAFQVGLAYDLRFDEEPVYDFFAGDLVLGQRVNTVSFPESFMNLPVVRTPVELDLLLQEFPFDFMAIRPMELSLSDRLRGLYAQSMARGNGLPSIARLAPLCGLAPSTLRRRLKQENISIRALKDAARRDVALEMISRGGHSIETVAAKTGFRHTDGFRSAFRRWTNLSPRDYRKTMT
ncbi:helix-turn-helix transcriptional regulator [Novosphingobium naphthalenivorans]|uniref:helix-turn-helix transcriptional regulator n=1 Tax=Novosphingobium naphthalenivorans TaxID=273168 RepID=UPI001C3F1F75|nr:AraC family transcriptional regulator [Novosphingobium naphthalenivorans]